MIDQISLIFPKLVLNHFPNEYTKNADNTESSSVLDIFRRPISQITSPYCFNRARTTQVSFFEHQFKKSMRVKSAAKNIRHRTAPFCPLII